VQIVALFESIAEDRSITQELTRIGKLFKISNSVYISYTNAHCVTSKFVNENDTKDCKNIVLKKVYYFI